MLYSTMPNARQSGIYAITNSVTGGFYIGSSTNLAVRKRNHFTDLRCGVHCKRDPALVARTAAGNRGKKRTPEQRAKFATVATPERIAKMRAAKMGKRRSQATKDKHAATMRALWQDPEYRARVLAARPNTTEIVAKRAAANRGKKRSEETRARLAEICRRNAEACRGKKQTPEHVAKRLAWRGGDA